MALKKTHLTKLNKIVNDKGLLEVVNAYLKDNNLPQVEVESIKLKSKTITAADLVCPPTHKKVEICTIDGDCYWECVPK